MMGLGERIPTRPSQRNFFFLFFLLFLLQTRGARVHPRDGFSSYFANGVYPPYLQELRGFISGNYALLNMQVNAFYLLIKSALDPVQLRHSSDSRI